MYILDTDVLTLLDAGHTGLQRHKDQLDRPEVVTTVVTRIEVLRGRFDFVLKAADGPQLLRALQWLARSESLLLQIPVIPLDDAAAAEFDRLRQDRTLKKIGRADLLIASITLARRATLVTRNLKHFQQVPGLQQENWVD